MSISSKLKKANKAWQKVKDDDDGDDFEKRPDGKYKVKIDRVEIIEPDSGNVLLALGGKIKEGDEKGNKCDSVFLLVNKKGELNEWGVKFARRALKALGGKVSDDMDAWPEACKKIQKAAPLALLKLSTGKNKDFQNLAVVKLLNGDDESEVSGSESGDRAGSVSSSEESASSESESGSGSESESGSESASGSGSEESSS